MSHQMRLLHLSDLHLSGLHKERMQTNVIEPLLVDLINQNDQCPIDMVLITGDILSHGGFGFENIREGYAYFEANFVTPLQKKLGLRKNQIFFVPGNHDIDRSADSEVVETGLRGILTDEKSVSNFQSKITQGSTEGVMRILGYKTFEQDFYGDMGSASKNLSIFESIFISEVAGRKIGVCCLNTAWRAYSSKTDKGLLIVGQQQLDKAIAFMRDCEYRILLAHHTPEHWVPFEMRELDNAISANFDFCFFGHNHSPDTWTKTSYKGTAFTSISRSSQATNNKTADISYMNGYSLFDISLAEIQQRPRVYAKDLNKFVKDTAIVGDEEYFSLPIRTRDTSVLFLHKVASHIRGTAVDVLNSHLISSGVESGAPSTIDGVFVQPRLIKYAETEDEEEVAVSMDELLNSRDNYAIFGLKETGKTILLDKLAINFLNQTNDLHQVPILIDFRQIGHRRIETLITQFSGVPILEVPEQLSKHSFTLLIDNFRFENEYVHIHQKLHELITAYPTTRLICTSQLMVEGQVPVEFFQGEIFLKINILLLKYFRTKQIRELTEKWYSASRLPLPERKDRIEKITKLLLALKLPRTPMAISMFLWILEKQEDYQPVNQAVMLENFIEKLFMKHSKEESYFRDFDYRNKEALLIAMAVEMLRLGNDCYYITYSDALGFIVKHLKSRHFPFEAKKILDHFVEVGVFKLVAAETETTVQFRFNCFFQYFVMKNMENQEFYDYVIAEDHYLTFFEEIDYFTGLRRNKTELLKLLLSRMETLFKGLNEEAKTLTGGYDYFFLNDASAVKNLPLTAEAIAETKNHVTNDEIDKYADNRLEAAPADHDVELKTFTLTRFDRLGRSWTLASKVLRNTEETSEEGLKYGAFKSILQSSFSYMGLYKTLVLKELKKKEANIPKQRRVESEMLIRFLPVAHEILMYETMGSTKLELIFLQHIDNVLEDQTVSDIEKFVCVFLYADSKGKNFSKYLKRLLVNLKNKYFMDMMLFKVLTYYYVRSDSKDSDLLYENIIADILLKARGIEKDKKSGIMADYKRKRSRYELDESDRS